MSTPSFTEAQLMALTVQVGEMSMAQGDHALALTALLNAYMSLAVRHPCCLSACAHNATRVAGMLTGLAAVLGTGPVQPAPAAHLH